MKGVSFISKMNSWEEKVKVIQSPGVPTLLFFCKHLQALHEVSVAFTATLQPSGDLSSKTRANLLKAQPGGWVSIWRGS